MKKFVKTYNLNTNKKGKNNKRHIYCLIIFIILLLNKSYLVTKFSNSFTGRLIFIFLIIFTSLEDSCVGLMVTLLFICFMDSHSNATEGFSFDEVKSKSGTGITNMKGKFNNVKQDHKGSVGKGLKNPFSKEDKKGGGGFGGFGGFGGGKKDDKKDGGGFGGFGWKKGSGGKEDKNDNSSSDNNYKKKPLDDSETRVSAPKGATINIYTN